MWVSADEGRETGVVALSLRLCTVTDDYTDGHVSVRSQKHLVKLREINCSFCNDMTIICSDCHFLQVGVTGINETEDL